MLIITKLSLKLTAGDQQVTRINGTHGVITAFLPFMFFKLISLNMYLLKYLLL